MKTQRFITQEEMETLRAKQEKSKAQHKEKKAMQKEYKKQEGIR